MGIEQAIVTGVAIVIVIVLFLIFMDYLHPLYIQHQFQEICRMYVLIAEAENGLSSNAYKNLKYDLEEIGVKVIEMNIDVIGSVKRLDQINFKVRGEVFVAGFKSLYEREEKAVELLYEASQIARRVLP